MNYQFTEKDFCRMRKHFVLGIVIVAIIGFAFYFVSGNSLFETESETVMPNRENVTEYLAQGVKVLQPFAAQGDLVKGVTFYVTTRGHEQNTDTLNVTMKDRDGNCIASGRADTALMQNYSNFTVYFDEAGRTKQGETYFLSVESESGEENNSVALYYGESRGYNRYKVDSAVDSGSFLFGDNRMEGNLCLSFINTKLHTVGQYYWVSYSLCLLLLAMFLVWQYHQAKKRKMTRFLSLYKEFKCYWFLINQLVNRDFKAKYKRSMLGILWSFLNPLLTMMVQYVVFSTLFKSDTPNYVVYLFTGIICFNYVNEACNMSLTSIVGNAALITKVYVPKYLYPMTRIITSSINMLLSMVPLFAAVLMTGLPIRPSFALIPFDLLCMFFFSMGLGLMLSTMMVYFRDTQFLWNVFSLLWCYMTPCFYTINILPRQLFPWYYMNPLYHYVSFLRTVMIDGVCPEPSVFFICLVSALAVFFAGTRVFKSHENSFVLHL